MTHNNNGQDFWLQEVPPTANQFMVESETLCFLNIANQDDVVRSLPTGTWQIHSDSTTITEEQAGEIVEGYDSATGGGDYQDYYRNYEGSQDEADFPWFAGDPIKSYASLLRSLGLDGKRIINLKKI